MEQTNEMNANVGNIDKKTMESITSTNVPMWAHEYALNFNA